MAIVKRKQMDDFGIDYLLIPYQATMLAPARVAHGLPWVPAGPQE